MKNMEKTMIEAKVSYYDSSPWTRGEHQFLIRGFALDETMLPVMIHHGEKRAYPWPWLFIWFATPVTVRKESGELVSCENSLMVWRPGKTHCYGNENGAWMHSWLIADSPDLERMLDKWPIPTGVPVHVDAGPVFETYLPLLRQELADEGDEFCLKNLLQLFIYNLHRCCKRNLAPVPARVREMVLYLQKNLQKNLTVEGVAAHFGLSAPHFAALFREYYHKSPMSYLNSLRMNRAARLLSLYPYTCKEIALQTGFRDSLYFSRRFHHYWGVSPRDYRKKEEEKSPD